VAYFQSTRRYFTSSQSPWPRDPGVFQRCGITEDACGPHSGACQIHNRCIPISIARIPVSGFSHQIIVDHMHAIYIQSLTDEFTALKLIWESGKPNFSLTLGSSRCFSSWCYLHLLAKTI